ncbi:MULTISPECIES: hypothetical protein [unclassified Thioalkalivibrio]|uniref:hypothetical protein n=1 Tax=unclassified Thioalkalivibrio TaxID=2621013 RepID=UPI000362B77E|nr:MULTISPECIES: hypothetical protein [unclassified Thioalkalivibrio]
MNQNTYLTPEQAAARLQFNTRYFRNVIMKEHLVEGVHFVRAFDRRKYLIIWEKVEETLLENQPVTQTEQGLGIPMARGGVCHA